MSEVKKRRRQSTRISSKHQVTIPVDALRAAGLKPGDQVTVRTEAPGRVVIEREEDIVAKYAGDMPGVFDREEFERARDEWDERVRDEWD
jgi:bifunctional DNA-binding transcriptional regulator/antitoxin component of YhaV-PrlF toxin-antitoxin module